MVIPTSFCNELSTNPAVQFVSGGYATFVTLAEDTYQATIESVTDLNDFTVDPLEFNVSFNFEGQLAPFQRPLRPEFDLGALDFVEPAGIPEAPAFVSEIPDVEAAPTFTEQAPVLTFGPRPDTPTIPVPVAPADAPPLVMPDKPTYTLPPVPTFEQLNLPNSPSITLPQFDAERPTFTGDTLIGDFGFNPEEYDTTSLAVLQGKITEWLQGGTGLPEAIEQALFARARERVDEGVVRDLQVASEVHSARGFTEPNGALNGRIRTILRDGDNARNEINRDLTIRFHEEELVNIRQAFAQGIALEGLLVNLHIEEQRLLLQAANFQRETAIAVLNARISIFNAQNQAYQVEASVFEARIRASLAEVQLFRAQIEGEIARGQINEQRVRLYAEQLRPVGLMADFYKTQVEAVEIEAEANRQNILTFQAKVDAFGKRWDAFGRQLEAHRADIDGQKARAEIFESQTTAFGTRVQAYDRVQNARFERERLRIAQHDQSLSVWQAQLQKLLAYVQKEQARISSVAQSFDAQARMYQADAAVETAAAAATDRSFELGLRREEARTNVALKQAEVKIQEAIQLLSLILKAKETKTSVLGQLSSAAMAAVNFSAGVSSNQSASQSCSTSVGWSGEAPDLQ